MGKVSEPVATGTVVAGCTSTWLLGSTAASDSAAGGVARPVATASRTAGTTSSANAVSMAGSSEPRMKALMP
jgi:hypothetical protein